MPSENQVVQVYEREVYGSLKVYPANVAAEKFAEIAGTTTLTPHAIKCIRELGYEVHRVFPPRGGK